jgi:glutathione S-transferase
MSEPTVYGPAFSTYTRSVRLALAEKGVSHQLVEIDILKNAQQASEHTARHPFAKVPSFEHDGNSFYETSAILRYIDEVFPGPALMPDTAVARARANQVLSVIDSYGYQPCIHGLFIPKILVPSLGGTVDEAKVEAAKGPATQFVGEIERSLGSDDFFGGRQVCLADLHLIPVLAYLNATPEGQAMLAQAPRLRAWYGRMSERASVRQMMPLN